MAYGYGGYGGMGGMGYRSPFDYVPPPDTGNVGYAYEAGQQNQERQGIEQQQMASQQTEDQLRQAQLAEATYQIGQQQASQEVQDALAKGKDSPEYEAAKTKYPSMMLEAESVQQNNQMKLQLAKLGIAAAQSKSFAGDLMSMPDKEDFVTHYDDMQQKYPGMMLPAKDEFSGDDGDSKYATWRDDWMARSGKTYQYGKGLAGLTANYLHAKQMEGPKGGPMTSAALEDLTNFRNKEHADMLKEQQGIEADRQKNMPKAPPADVYKQAGAFISQKFPTITDPAELARASEQLGSRAFAGVQSKKYPDLDTAFREESKQITPGATHWFKPNTSTQFGGESGSAGPKQSAIPGLNDAQTQSFISAAKSRGWKAGSSHLIRVNGKDVKLTVPKY